MQNKFKTEQGKWLTQSLFLEIGYRTEFAIFTLEDNEKTFKGKKYPSIKKYYLELEDPTEYEFASKYLGGWQHWKRICSNSLILEHITEWREELTLKLRGRGIQSMIDEATMGGRGQATAARWLAEKGFLDSPVVKRKKVGRPAKEEDLTQEARDMAMLKEDFAKDLARIKLN